MTLISTTIRAIFTVYFCIMNNFKFIEVFNEVYVNIIIIVAAGIFLSNWLWVEHTFLFKFFF